MKKELTLQEIQQASFEILKKSKKFVIKKDLSMFFHGERSLVLYVTKGLFHGMMILTL